MTTRLRLVLAAQLAFFALWGAALVRSHSGAPAVWLATQPVDPRDMLSGSYVALRYRISSAGTAGCDVAAAPAERVTVWVRLAEGDETVLTEEGPVSIAVPVACVLEPPAVADGVPWIAGRIEPGQRDEIRYGIERFYVAETSPLRAAQAGRVVAKVALAPDGSPRLLALVPIGGGGLSR